MGSIWEQLADVLPDFAYVRLVIYGRRFLRRSEAKRICAGLEQKRWVVLDFEDVEEVGEAFAYEMLFVPHWMRFEAINAQRHRAAFLRARLRHEKQI